MSARAQVILSLIVLVAAALGDFRPATAMPIGGGFRCEQCLACGCSECKCGAGLCVSKSEGSVCTAEQLFDGGGNSLPLALHYVSMDADGSRAFIDQGLGYGWSHTYSQLLFTQRGHMFWRTGEGHISQYRRVSATQFEPLPGNYETLIYNSDGSFTLTEKDGTVRRFARVPGDTLMIGGPVWRLKEVTARNNRKTAYDYDGSGRLVQVRDETFNYRLDFGYTGNRLTTVTDHRTGRTAILQYDSTGRKLLKVTDAVGNDATFTYNVKYQITGKTDRAGRSFTVGYASGKPVNVKDGSGAQTFSYTNPTNWAVDNLVLARTLQRELVPSTTTETDGNGNAWHYDYDNHGFVTQTVAPDGATTKTDYDPASLLPSKVTDANGNVSSYTYDDLGNRITDTDAKGFVTSYEYGVPLTAPPENRFCRDQVSRITYPNGSVTTYEYDTTTDANGLVRCNRIKEARDQGGLNLITQWQYDSRGLMTQALDPNGHPTTYDHDASGNRIQVTDAEGNSTRYAYDDAADRTCMVDGNGHVTVYEYDALNRLVRETAKIGTVVAPTDPIEPACTPADGDDIITAEYYYDGNGNQTLVRRQENTSTPRAWQVTQQIYDLRNRLAQEIGDPAGEPLNPSPSPLNLVTSHTYDGNDNRIRTTDPRDNSTLFGYDSQNRLQTVTDALGYVTTYSYDPVGNRIQETDGNGHNTCSQYDALNRLTVQIRKMGASPCSLTAASDLVTQNFYDAGAPIACDHDPGSPQCDGPMPGSSNIAYSIDPEGKYTYYKYDKVDRRWITIRKVGDTADTCDPPGAPNEQDWCEYTKYDAADNVVARIDANGNRTGMAYYANDWLASETQDPGGLNLTTSYTYDGTGNQRTVTTPRGNVVTSTYDERNQLAQVDDTVGRVASYDYDGIGNRVQECDGNDNCTGYSYDKVNRLIDIVDPMGEAALNAYDKNGNLIKVTDREGHVTCHDYDADNRRFRTAQLMGGTNCALLSFQDIWTDTEYDAVGNVKRLLTARLNSTPAACAGGSPPDDCQITAYDYDEADRLVLEIYADTTTRQFAYDKAGNLSDRVDQLGQVTLYQYNDLYYLTKRDYQDPAEPDDSFEYDIGGRMTVATKDYPAADPRPDWVVTFDAYDAVNRLLQTTQDALGVPTAVGYDYDTPAGRRTLFYPGGRVVTEFTDLRERLETVNRGPGPAFPITPLAFYQYDLGNRAVTRDYDNGVTASYAYNTNDWITELVHAAGATGIADFRYDYDKEGNKRYEEKSPAFLAGQSEAYHYDDVYRLIEYKVGDLVGSDVPVPITQRQYDLDKVGNWDQFTVDDDGAGPGVPVVYNNTPNQMNEYDDWSTDGPGEIPDDLGLDINFADPEPTPPEDGENWAHDKNGNRREDGQRVYEYDDENRLVRVTRKIDGVVSEYGYDALSRRVAKTVDALGASVETRFGYDDARVIEEQDGLGATIATYVYGNYIDEVLSMQRGGNDYYYHQNALWSVSAVTDALANVVERYAYTDYGCPTITDGAGVPVAPNAWGTAHSAIGNPYMFTGRRWDEESGLYYYRARYYDCEIGRFLQRDPLGYVDGANLYQYGYSGPTAYVDPIGLKWDKVTGARYIYCANETGDRLSQLASDLTGNKDDWQCIWPVKDWKNQSGYSVSDGVATRGDKANAENLFAPPPRVVFRAIVAGDVLAGYRSVLGGDTPYLHPQSVAGAIKRVSGEGASPIHEAYIAGHGSRTEEGIWALKKIKNAVTKKITDQWIAFTSADLLRLNKAPEYSRAIQKHGPVRCWFTRSSNVWLMGCNTGHSTARPFAQNVLRKGGVAHGSNQYLGWGSGKIHWGYFERSPWIAWLLGKHGWKNSSDAWKTAPVWETYPGTQ